MNEVVTRFDAPTEGGYDERRFDPERKVTTFTLGGAPHNAAGAATLWWGDDGTRMGSYWLYGVQVPQAQVHRLIAGADVFDDTYRRAWVAMCDDVAAALDDGDDAAARALVQRWREHPVDDDGIYDDPSVAIAQLGRSDAAQRLQRALSMAAVHDRPARSAVDEVAGGLEAMMARISD